MITGKYPQLRLRRNRKSLWSRKLIQENTLSPSDFILPIFLIEGSNKKESISSMPGVYRYTINRLSQIIDRAIKKGIPMVALFPKTKNNLKNEIGSESLNENNLVCRAIIEIKKRYKNQIGIMCDVALDPYTSHGHDGLIKSGYVLNDETNKVEKNQINLIDVIVEEEAKTEKVDVIDQKNLKSINDIHSISPQTSLADQFGQQPILDLTKEIGINEKYLITENLFSGDNDAYLESINELNDFENIDQANNYLNKTLLKKYSWNSKSNHFKRLNILVQRRYHN